MKVRPVIVDGILYQSMTSAAIEIGVTKQTIKYKCLSERFSEYEFTMRADVIYKRCSKCGKLKKIEEFHKDSTKKYGLESWCKRCKKEQTLLKNFRINIEEYNRLFELQEGCCAICGRHQSTCDRSLAVDHNHKTGEVRGLLCMMCNTGIGNLLDDVTILKNAINYLENDRI